MLNETEQTIEVYVPSGWPESSTLRSGEEVGVVVSYSASASPRDEIQIPGVRVRLAGGGGRIATGDLVLIPARDDSCTVRVTIGPNDLSCEHLKPESRRTALGYTLAEFWRRIEVPLALALTVVLAPLLVPRATDALAGRDSGGLLGALVGLLPATCAVFLSIFPLALLREAEFGIVPYQAAIAANFVIPLALVRPFRPTVSAGLIGAALMGCVYAGIGLVGFGLATASVEGFARTLVMFGWVFAIPLVLTLAAGLLTSKARESVPRRTTATVP